MIFSLETFIYFYSCKCIWFLIRLDFAVLYFSTTDLYENRKKKKIRNLKNISTLWLLKSFISLLNKWNINSSPKARSAIVTSRKLLRETVEHVPIVSTSYDYGTTMTGLEKIRPVCENGGKLINNNDDVRFFFLSHRQWNLLAYNNNNNNNNRKKKWENEKRRAVWIMVVCLGVEARRRRRRWWRRPANFYNPI